MKTSELIKSKFIRKADLIGAPPLVLTIADVTTEKSNNRGGNQAVMWFQETEKGLGLNNTKLKTLETAYGPDTDQWVGHRVRLSHDPDVKFGDVPVGCVRLETPQRRQAANGQGAPATPAAARPPPPVWDPVRQEYVAAAQPTRPPPPVWSEELQAWVAPTTAPAAPTVAAPRPVSDEFGPPPQTIAQRVAASNPPPFDDEIPF